MYDRRENEHQELFHLGIDPRQPVPIHIPSPLGRLGYFFFVRVPAGDVETLANVGMRLDVGGLREDHLEVMPGEGVEGDAVLPGVDGLAWRCLGKGMVSRGDGTVVLKDWPAAMTRADLLITTWPRFVESGMADAWIAARADPCWAPSGVPLGGIGGGRVDLCRDGRFRNFSMNNNQDAPVEDPDGLPGAYLAVTRDGSTCDLATQPIAAGHAACESLAYEPRFPQAVLAAEPFPGITVRVTASGLVCPQDLRRSSISGFLVRWEVTNTGEEPQTVTVRMGWPNLIGVGGGVAEAESGIGYGDGFYHHWDDPTGRAETTDGGAVRFTGTPKYLASAGEHLLAVAGGAATAGDGHGEVHRELHLQPGETGTSTMALVAAMPHWVDSLKVDRGHAWQNHFADGRAMLDALLAEADDILTEAGALAALMADSTLPDWLRRRLCNCAYPLVTNSVYYRDGRFSVNEGPTEMAGCYGTIDQRLAAHPATQLLFPQLNRTELTLFAENQGADGGINHDLGGGHLERGVHPQDWPDLTCSFIIQTARHAWTTGDTAFEDAMWPRARQALLKHAAWAEDGAGVAQVGSNGLGTSYDGYHYEGTTGYMATLWLAALAVMERWADRRGDSELLARIPGWRDAAIARLDADLWNGEYYIAYGSQDGARRESCHAGQLAGEVFARLLAGADVLPEARLRACLNAIFRLNGDNAFAVPPDEVWPDGTAAAAFGWLPYIEGFMLTVAAVLDDPRLLPLWERMMAAVDAEGGRPCDTRLMYQPDGSPSWGAYYMTAPASWLVYDALLDFSYTPGDGALRLRATRPGRWSLVHPLFWGLAEVAEDGTVTLMVRRVFQQDLAVVSLAVPAGAGLGYKGEKLSPAASRGQYCLYDLQDKVNLVDGVTLTWKIEQQSDKVTR
ncbi:MAG: hypothetical protein BWY76_00102 [bacterium ADurb.Bin429]|nr:MAG: hypothetical protein BWY76_00102 [bacterium ADurb.Bin429]